MLCVLIAVVVWKALGLLAIIVLLELCVTGSNNDEKAVFRGELAGFKCLAEPSSIFQRSKKCWKL